LGVAFFLAVTALERFPNELNRQGIHKKGEAVDSASVQDGGGATMAYSNDLRVRLIRGAEKGRSARSQAGVFEVSPSTAVKWVKAFRSEGRAKAKPHGGGRRSPLEPHCDWLKARVEQQPDLTLHELCAELLTRGVTTSKSAVSRLLLRLGFSYKKNGAGQRTGAPGCGRETPALARRSSQPRS
jgi:transposase